MIGGAGLELPTPPLSSAGQLNSQELQGLFINQHVGYAQPTASGQNLQIVKREPEDLSHHRKLDCSSPSSGSLDGSIIIPKQSRAKVTCLFSDLCLFISVFLPIFQWDFLMILWWVNGMPMV